MPRLKVCAVFDSAVQAYMRPMFVPHQGAAVRGFSDEVNRKADGNPLGAHPNDYELHLLAEWDEETGGFVVLNESQDVVLIRGIDCVQQ